MKTDALDILLSEDTKGALSQLQIEAKEELDELKAWYEAIADECAIDFVEMTSPRETITKLLSWNMEMALDPQISEEANKLIEKHTKELKTELAEKDTILSGLKKPHVHGATVPQTSCTRCCAEAALKALTDV